MQDAPSTPPRLAIVVPCYNEEACLQSTIDTLSGLISGWIEAGKIDGNSFCCYVDDGSTDRTWSIVEAGSGASSVVRGIHLARNSGHQKALLAGMNRVRPDCDCVVTIDADLQDDPLVIEEMLAHYKEGSRIVFGVRNDRTTDSFFKRNTALFFYTLMKWMGVEIIPNHSDFRLLDAHILDCLSAYEERNLFLRGIMASLGFRQSKVYYKRAHRTQGESKYPFWRMLSFAWDGITSFSIAPLRFIFFMGIAFLGLSMVMILWIILSWMADRTVPGWASLSVAASLFGGCQFFAMGILGEYLGKIYSESKARPRYFIDDESGWRGS